MPDTDNSQSFYQSIKDFIPVVGGAALGALAGGRTAGLSALAGAGGAEEAEQQQRALQAQQQEKYIGLLEHLDQQKAQQQWRQSEIDERKWQDHQTNQWRQLTQINHHEDVQDAIQQRADAAAQSTAERAQAAQLHHEDMQAAAAEREALARLSQGDKYIDRAHFDNWLKGQPPEVQKDGEAASGDPRMMTDFFHAHESAAALNREQTRQSYVDQISKLHPDWDPTKLAAATNGMDGRRLKSVADAMSSGKLVVGSVDDLADAGIRDAKNDAKSRKTLSGDLSKAWNAYDKLGVLGRAVGAGRGMSRGQFIVSKLTDADFEGLNDKQITELKPRLIQHFNEVKTPDFDFAAKMGFPLDGKGPGDKPAPAKAASASPPAGAEPGTYKGKSGYFDRKTNKFYPAEAGG